MIEMLGVLAIIGVLSAGGIMGYSVAMERYHINQAIDIITTTYVNAKSFIKNPKIGYDNIISGAELCRIGIIPNKYCKSYLNTNKVGSVLDKVVHPDALIALSIHDRQTDYSYLISTAKVQVPYTLFYGYFEKSTPLILCIGLVSHNWSNMADVFYFATLRKITFNTLTPTEAEIFCHSLDDADDRKLRFGFLLFGKVLKINHFKSYGK